VFPMCAFPVLLHLTLWPAVELLHMLSQPQTQFPIVARQRFKVLGG